MQNMKIPPRYRRPVLFALLLHVLVLLVLIFNFGPTIFRAPPGSAPMKTVQATAVSEAQVQAAIHAAHQEKTEVRAQASALAQQEKEKIAKQHTEKLAVEKALALKQLKIAAAKKEKIKKQQAEKLKLAALKQQKIAEKKAKKLVEQKKIHALQQKLIQQQLNSEAKDISSVTSQAQQQGAIDQYKAAIVSAIQSNWRIDQINKQLKCIYTVNLAPDGTVLSVQLVKSSGSDSLDQSAKQAITLASPLPVPHNPVLFNHFRQLVLTLSPQGVTQG